MSGADLVLNHLADEGGAQLGRERECRVLVDRPECVVPAVSAREPEHLRLAPAAAAAWREPARESRQVEHLDLERRRPEVTVVRAQQQPVEPARAVVRARDDRLSACRVRRTGLPGGARRRQGRRDAQGERGPPRAAHSSHSANASVPPPERSTTITLRRARPSPRTSTRMNPLARFAKRVPSSAVTRTRWPKMPPPLSSTHRARAPPITR